MAAKGGSLDSVPWKRKKRNKGGTKPLSLLHGREGEDGEEKEEKEERSLSRGGSLEHIRPRSGSRRTVLPKAKRIERLKGFNTPHLNAPITVRIRVPPSASKDELADRHARSTCLALSETPECVATSSGATAGSLKSGMATPAAPTLLDVTQSSSSASATTRKRKPCDMRAPCRKKPNVSVALVVAAASLDDTDHEPSEKGVKPPLPPKMRIPKSITSRFASDSTGAEACLLSMSRLVLVNRSTVWSRLFSHPTNTFHDTDPNHPMEFEARTLEEAYLWVLAFRFLYIGRLLPHCDERSLLWFWEWSHVYGVDTLTRYTSSLMCACLARLRVIDTIDTVISSVTRFEYTPHPEGHPHELLTASLLAIDRIMSLGAKQACFGNPLGVELRGLPLHMLGLCLRRAPMLTMVSGPLLYQCIRLWCRENDHSLHAVSAIEMRWLFDAIPCCQVYDSGRGLFVDVIRRTMPMDGLSDAAKRVWTTWRTGLEDRLLRVPGCTCVCQSNDTEAVIGPRGPDTCGFWSYDDHMQRASSHADDTSEYPVAKRDWLSSYQGFSGLHKRWVLCPEPVPICLPMDALIAGSRFIYWTDTGYAIEVAIRTMIEDAAIVAASTTTTSTTSTTISPTLTNASTADTIIASPSEHSRLRLWISLHLPLSGLDLSWTNERTRYSGSLWFTIQNSECTSERPSITLPYPKFESAIELPNSFAKNMQSGNNNNNNNNNNGILALRIHHFTRSDS